MELIVTFDRLLENVKNDLAFSELYLTPISFNYNYAHKKRLHEVRAKLAPHFQKLVDFKKNFITACDSMYHNETAIEWLRVYHEPYLDRVYTILRDTKAQSKMKYWRPRPLNIKLRNYNMDVLKSD